MVADLQNLQTIGEFAREKNLSSIPYFPVGVQAGFPSPAGDYIEQTIDFNDTLIANKASRFVTQATGDSMNEAGIMSGSYLIVDRSITPKNNSIVLAIIDGEFLVKYFEKKITGIRLVAANKKYPPITITEGMDFRVWGVVTAVVTLDPK